MLRKSIYLEVAKTIGWSQKQRVFIFRIVRLSKLLLLANLSVFYNNLDVMVWAAVVLSFV